MGPHRVTANSAVVFACTPAAPSTAVSPLLGEHTAVQHSQAHA